MSWIRDEKNAWHNLDQFAEVFHQQGPDNQWWVLARAKSDKTYFHTKPIRGPYASEKDAEESLYQMMVTALDRGRVL